MACSKMARAEPKERQPWASGENGPRTGTPRAKTIPAALPIHSLNSARADPHSTMWPDVCFMPKWQARELSAAGAHWANLVGASIRPRHCETVSWGARVRTPGNPTDEPLSTAAEPCLGANGSRRPPTSPHGSGERKGGTLFGREWLSPEGRGVKSAPEQGLKFLFAEHRDAQLPGLFELAARFVASDHEVGLTRHARSSAAPVPLDQFVDLVA